MGICSVQQPLSQELVSAASGRANDSLTCRNASPSFADTSTLHMVGVGCVPPTTQLDPRQIRFTHDRISPSFSSGIGLDDTIESILTGQMKVDTIPPLEVVEHHAQYYSLSNRRLFVFRVLASLGKMSRIAVKIVPPSSPRVMQLAVDKRLGCVASKWERALSTKNNGVSVEVGRSGSRYYKHHFSCLLDVPAHLLSSSSLS